MYGTKETEDFLRLAKTIVEGIKAAKENDGKVDLRTDYIHFLQMPGDLFAAIDGAGDVPKEFSDLDGTEIAELQSKFGEIVNNPHYQAIFGHLLGISKEVRLLISQAA